MYEFIVFLLNPFMILSIWCGLAIMLLWRKRRERRWRLCFLTIPYVLLMIFSLPITGQLGSSLFESAYPPLEDRPANIEAIVVLGGYVRRANGVITRPELGWNTVKRCIRAAELYHEGKRVPVLLTGRLSSEEGIEPSLARVMGDFMLQLGVSSEDVLLEENSTDTWENAVESAKTLRELDISQIAIVTDGTHLPRAIRSFEEQGLYVVPVGSFYSSKTMSHLTVTDFLPSGYAPATNQRVFHELVGKLWYWIRRG